MSLTLGPDAQEGLGHASRQGRQRVYELCDGPVAQLVKSLMAVAGAEPARYQYSYPQARACTCYYHLAGRVRVALFDDSSPAEQLKDRRDPRLRWELA